MVSLEAAKRAARNHARGAIVHWSNRRQGWRLDPCEKTDLVAALRPTLRNPSEVDDNNFVRVSIDLLKTFYPEDFKAERAMATLMQRTSPSAADVPSWQSLTFRSSGRRPH